MKRLLLAALNQAVAAREAAALVTVVEATGQFFSAVGAQWVVTASDERLPVGEPPLAAITGGEAAVRILAELRQAAAGQEHCTLRYQLPGGEMALFVEVQRHPPHLIVVGAGHIAAPLAAMAKLCDFEVSVLDDRALYANRKRFPTADRVIAGAFRTELQALREGRPAFAAGTFVVLVTRGHQYDVESLLELIDDPPAYIGMIGSQRRIQAVFELLEREYGLAPEKLDRIYAPVGIDIGARTPAEIAVCILAEIINVQRGGRAPSLSHLLRSDRLARLTRVTPNPPINQ
jgi:xanthine dehydrogenase accessory factor